MYHIFVVVLTLVQTFCSSLTSALSKSLQCRCIPKYEFLGNIALVWDVPNGDLVTLVLSGSREFDSHCSRIFRGFSAVLHWNIRKSFLVSFVAAYDMLQSCLVFAFFFPFEWISTNLYEMIQVQVVCGNICFAVRRTVVKNNDTKTNQVM